MLWSSWYKATQMSSCKFGPLKFSKLCCHNFSRQKKLSPDIKTIVLYWRRASLCPPPAKSVAKPVSSHQPPPPSPPLGLKALNLHCSKRGGCVHRMSGAGARLQHVVRLGQVSKEQCGNEILESFSERVEMGFWSKALSTLRNFLVNLNSATNFWLYCALGSATRFSHSYPIVQGRSSAAFSCTPSASAACTCTTPPWATRAGRRAWASWARPRDTTRHFVAWNQAAPEARTTHPPVATATTPRRNGRCWTPVKTAPDVISPQFVMNA